MNQKIFQNHSLFYLRRWQPNLGIKKKIYLSMYTDVSRLYKARLYGATLHHPKSSVYLSMCGFRKEWYYPNFGLGVVKYLYLSAWLQWGSRMFLMPAIHYVHTTKKKEIVENLAKKLQYMNQSAYIIHSLSEFWRTSHVTQKIPLMFRQKTAQSRDQWWNTKNLFCKQGNYDELCPI